MVLRYRVYEEVQLTPKKEEEGRNETDWPFLPISMLFLYIEERKEEEEEERKEEKKKKKKLYHVTIIT